MAETWNKKEREKKKQQDKKEKAERKLERKENGKESKSPRPTGLEQNSPPAVRTVFLPIFSAL
ncbi:MAG: hypothetical protein ACXWC7_16055 [Chitinophagaceae bacterium]